MLDSRKEQDDDALLDELDEVETPIEPEGDDDEESLSISDRRARRKAKRRGDKDEEAAEEALTTKEKETSTRTQKDALKARKRQSQAFGENIPVLGKVLAYFRGVSSEVQKVTWPTRDEAQRLTLIVVSVTVLFAVFLGAFDLFYGTWFKEGIQDTLLFVVVGVVFLGIGGSLSWYFILREDM